jgi:class 3 adenylate cyclase
MRVIAFLRRLAAYARVVTFDKRGGGLSDRISGAPTLEDRIDDARAVMAAIGSRRAVVIGCSEGGCTSALFAATHPERGSYLILIGYVGRGPDRSPDDAWQSLLHSETDSQIPAEWGRKFAAAIPGGRIGRISDRGALFWVGDTEAIHGDIVESVTGPRDGSSGELERVLATVMFTDIVESTRSASAMGDQRWRRLLDDHDLLAQQMIGRHRGNLVKRTGDGVVATFDGPGRAVRCALAFGSAARQIGLPLRTGLHTGEIEIRGNDIGGIAVHAAARVMSLSGADEVLVSRVVTDLVAGTGLKFTERGTFELKGLPGHWDLFAASG